MTSLQLEPMDLESFDSFMFLSDCNTLPTTDDIYSPLAQNPELSPLFSSSPDSSPPTSPNHPSSPNDGDYSTTAESETPVFAFLGNTISPDQIHSIGSSEEEEETKEVKKKRPRKRARRASKKDYTPTAVSLPRDQLLKLTSKEMDDYAENLRKTKKLSTEEEKDLKRQRRLIKNRESAHLSRQRRKSHLSELEDKVKSLTDENTELRSEVFQLKTSNDSLKQEVRRLKDQVKAPTKSTLSTVLDAVSIQKASSPMRVAGVYLLVLLFSFGIFFGKLGPSPLTAAPAVQSILPQSFVLSEDRDSSDTSIVTFQPFGRGGRELLQADHMKPGLFEEEGVEKLDIAHLTTDGLLSRTKQDACEATLYARGDSKSLPIIIDDVSPYVLDSNSTVVANNTSL